MNIDTHDKIFYNDLILVHFRINIKIMKDPPELIRTFHHS